jgi:hypothetical protein
MSAEPDPEVASKQALVDVFRNLARYATRKTRRDAEALGVTAARFTVEALDACLRASAVASTAALLERARQGPLELIFAWTARGPGAPLRAGLELSIEPSGDLRARLLWLALPEKVPVAARVGVVDGRKPLPEAVTELLRVRAGERLEPYAPPS